MSTQVQIRRSDETDNTSFVGARSEVTHDMPLKALRVHDGATPGGNRTLMESELGVAGGIATLDDNGAVPEAQLSNLPKSSDYDTIADVEAAQIGVVVLYLRTAGYYTPGDNGGALYKRVASEPQHAGKVQSEDGAWW